nr:hypothetical protein CFP56_58214 [Quercus suber]
MLVRATGYQDLSIMRRRYARGWTQQTLLIRGVLLEWQCTALAEEDHVASECRMIVDRRFVTKLSVRNVLLSGAQDDYRNEALRQLPFKQHA